MARVSGGTPVPGGAGGVDGPLGGAHEAGRDAAPFVLDVRDTPGYRAARLVFISLTGAWFRPAVSGRAHVPTQGPAILAPVHRSFADFAFAGFVTRRKLFFMAKDELWHDRALGRLLVGLGAFPVHREGADREALRRAQRVLELGQLLVLFPEGTRKEGTLVGDLHEGAAFLAARTGAPIVPIGIGGSDTSMPKGSHVPRPIRIHVVVGEPVVAPTRTDAGRVPRSSIHQTTGALRTAIQRVYDQAREEFEADAARRAR